MTILPLLPTPVAREPSIYFFLFLFGLSEVISSFLIMQNFFWYFFPQIVAMIHSAMTLRARSTKNADIHTGPLACPFAKSLAPLTLLLAPHYLLCWRALLRSLICLLAHLARGTVVAIYSVFVYSGPQWCVCVFVCAFFLLFRDFNDNLSHSVCKDAIGVNRSIISQVGENLYRFFLGSIAGGKSFSFYLNQHATTIICQRTQPTMA